jgi:hypothetical protein
MRRWLWLRRDPRTPRELLARRKGQAARSRAGVLFARALYAMVAARAACRTATDTCARSRDVIRSV